MAMALLQQAAEDRALVAKMGDFFESYGHLRSGAGKFFELMVPAALYERRKQNLLQFPGFEELQVIKKLEAVYLHQPTGLVEALWSIGRAESEYYPLHRFLEEAGHLFFYQAGPDLVFFVDLYFKGQEPPLQAVVFCVRSSTQEEE